MLMGQGFRDSSIINYPAPCMLRLFCFVTMVTGMTESFKTIDTSIHQHHHHHTYSNNNNDYTGRATIHKYKSPRSIEQEQQHTTQFNKLKLLTHCQKCANPFQHPVTLSCGFTKCYNCLSPQEQCLSFSCLRTHSCVSHLKPTVLLEKILHQYNTTQTIETSLMDCSICLSTLHEPITTECGHTFCKDCLIRTMTQLNNKVCPYCRRQLARIGKPNQVISGWIDYLFNDSVDDEKEQQQQQDNSTIPLIQVVSPVIAFPSQPCLIHISQDTSLLLQDMIQHHPLKKQHYAICVFSNNHDFFEYGIMMQINRVEYLPDIRHSVIQAQGLFRLKIHCLTLDLDHCYIGNVTRFDDIVHPIAAEEEQMAALMDQQFIEHIKNKRWTLPSTITPCHPKKSVAPITNNKSSRPRPFSMRLAGTSVSQLNISTIATTENYPASRKTWSTLIQYLHHKPVITTLPIIIKKQHSRTNSSSTVSSTSFISFSSTNVNTLDALFHQELHPYIMQYLQESPSYLMQHYQLQQHQQQTIGNLVWWLAATNVLPLDYHEKIYLLSMDTLVERIMTLIIWVADNCSSRSNKSSTSSPTTA